MCQHIKEVAGDHKARSLFGVRVREGEEEEEEAEGGAELTTSVQEFQKKEKKKCVWVFFSFLPFSKLWKVSQEVESPPP